MHHTYAALGGLLLGVTLGIEFFAQLQGIPLIPSITQAGINAKRSALTPIAVAPPKSVPAAAAAPSATTAVETAAAAALATSFADQLGSWLGGN